MWCSWIVVVVMLPATPFVTGPYSVNVVVVEDNRSDTLLFGYRRSMPAVNMAEEKVKLMYSDFINFTFLYRNTSCDGDGTGALVADLHCEHTIGVFIGPGCREALEAIGPLSRSWNIPVITPVGSGLSNHRLFSLVTKLSPYSVRSYVEAMVAILTKFQWFNIAVIYDEDFLVSALMKRALVTIFGNSLRFDHMTFQFNNKGYTPTELQSLLVDASSGSRVIILLCNSTESRALMVQAYYLGYATSGEYVFFILELLSTVPGNYHWRTGHKDDEVFLMALGHAIWPYIDAKRQVNANFTSDVIRRSLLDYSYDYNGTEPTPYLCGYYDAVTMYASVLNETLASGEDPLNGTAITHRLWNRTFPGINDPVHMNDEGSRESQVTFSSFNIETGLLTPGAIYHYETNSVEDVPPHLFAWPYSNGVAPPNEPKCGFRNGLCVNKALSSTLIGTIAGLLGLIGVIGFAVTVFMYRGWKRQNERDLWWWKISSTDLILSAWNENSSMCLKHSKSSLWNIRILDDISRTDGLVDNNQALWKGQTVCLRRLPLKQLTITRAVLMEFKTLRDVSHSNLVRVFGACLEDKLKVLVTEHCVKGTLQDLLGNANVTLDAQFKFSLCTDIINGLCYLHDSPMRHHGRLNSNVCHIDNRFSVRLTDFGLPTVYSNVLHDVTSEAFKNECKWKAPEILRNGTTTTGTMESDIYSYGILLLEVVTRDSPFTLEAAYMTNAEIIQKVQDGVKPPFRPAIELPAIMCDLRELVLCCWEEDPKCRPSCQFVKSAIKRISALHGDTGSLLDNLMRRMELYANNLEAMVEEKTVELREEKMKSEKLLYQILPRSVADRLKAGLRVEPQVFDGVSLYFSDVVGFTQISAVSSPMEVVDLLNDLYSCFDAVIGEFDVYKVETIGDAYMVVSGLPQRNGNLHALNIARMSIKVLEAIQEFKIRHMPTESVKIRIGLHSGPVCAGVVGLKMPRYCLFGDTVNTASRMESSGKAMMIHISTSIKTLLDDFGSFHILPRGRIAVKGKGHMFTFWLMTSNSDLIVQNETQ